MGFCPFLVNFSQFFGPFEDKIALFVLFWSIFARFWAFLRTKSHFLSSGGLPEGTFWAFRAQKLGFCALLGFPRALFRPFERKSWVFVRFWASGGCFSGLSSAKVGFLRAFFFPMVRLNTLRALNSTFCAPATLRPSVRCPCDPALVPSCQCAKLRPSAGAEAPVFLLPACSGVKGPCAGAGSLLVGLCDCYEVLCLEGCAADEAAVNIFAGKEFFCVGRFAAAAVEN